jgi:hypothetical protein
LKVELEGREVTWCVGLAVLGIPVLTAVLVCAGMGVFVWLSPEAQDRSPGGAGAGAERPIQVTVTPQVQAVLPQGAVQITNTVPPAQIHEVTREVVKVPDVKVVNEVQASEVRFMPAPAQPRAESVPLPEPKRNTAPVVAPPDEFGSELPPPKGLKR